MTEQSLKELIQSSVEIAINSHVSSEATFKRVIDIINSIKVQFENSNIELLDTIQGMTLNRFCNKLSTYKNNLYRTTETEVKLYDMHLVKVIEDYEFKDYNELLLVHGVIEYIVNGKFGMLIANEMQHHFLNAMGLENVEWISNAEQFDKYFIREIGYAFDGSFKNILEAMELRKNKIWKLKLEEFANVTKLDYKQLEQLCNGSVAMVAVHVINGDLCFNIDRK